MRIVDLSPVLLASASVLAAACSATAAPRPAGKSPPAATSAPVAMAKPPSTITATAAASPSAPAAPSAPATSTAAVAAKPPEAPAACPAGMKLIEGDYCTEVEHECLVEWWAPQNRKRVCEQFKPTAKCTGSRVAKRYCIDTYEWPNQKGVRPEVMNHFYQAQVKCAAMGKRMCTESEWTFACEGPQTKPFPYGWVRDPRKCNGDHEWDGPDMKKVAARDAKELARLWKGVPSGSQPDCISDFGVADMPANTDEVCAGETSHAKFASVNTGGPWYSGVRNQCRPKVYTHDEGFYYYFLSFRCCANPDGKDNEPRTPKQVRDGMSWSTIEKLAGFTVAQMKEKLELKKQGRCECKPTDVRCKTMCGTLLGPDAKDGTDATRLLSQERRKIKP